MSNLEKTLYKILKDRLSSVQIDVSNFVIDGCTYNELDKVSERIKHCIDMLDIVYGATEEGKDE